MITVENRRYHKLSNLNDDFSMKASSAILPAFAEFLAGDLD